MTRYFRNLADDALHIAFKRNRRNMVMGIISSGQFVAKRERLIMAGLVRGSAAAIADDAPENLLIAARRAQFFDAVARALSVEGSEHLQAAE